MPEQPKILDIKLLPAQYKFVNSTFRNCLFSSGYGAGKTSALCYKLLKHSLIPNNLCFLGRKNRSSLQQTTLRTLLKGDGSLAPVLPQGSYEINESKSIIHLFGGGDIYYAGFDQEIKLQSLNLGAAFLDESIEISSDEFYALYGRLRNTIDPNRSVSLATNPGSPNHFLYNYFFQNPNKDKEVIQAKTTDNYHLPKDYIESLKALPEIEYRRFVLGEWCSPEGLCIYEFKRELHTQASLQEYDSYAIGIDMGYTDFTDMVMIGIKNNHYTIIDEFYANNVLNKEIIEYLKKWQDKNPKLILDPSEAEFIAELESNHFNVIKGKNNVNLGLSTVNDCFKNGWLDIVPTCKNLINSLELYAYKAGTEIPEHKWSHHPDSLRYAMMYLRGDGQHSLIEPHFYLDEDVDPAEHAERLWQNQGYNQFTKNNFNT